MAVIGLLFSFLGTLITLFVAAGKSKTIQGSWGHLTEIQKKDRENGRLVGWGLALLIIGFTFQLVDLITK